MFGFNKEEFSILKKFRTPEKIQDFLETIPINFEPEGDTCLSPRRVLRERRAHCIEGALLAASALMINGEKPLLLDLRATKNDSDHVVALFLKYGRFGAISKSNHAVLRYREPIYKTVRELALSYFHEYIDSKGKKTLREFSLRPFDLSMYDPPRWTISEDNLWFIPEDLDCAKHLSILAPKQNIKLRPADPLEMKLDALVSWTKE
ncbi:MAG: hypothetical protein AAB682_01265 [Patescibacteria group bacterium]